MMSQYFIISFFLFILSSFLLASLLIISSTTSASLPPLTKPISTNAVSSILAIKEPPSIPKFHHTPIIRSRRTTSRSRRRWRKFLRPNKQSGGFAARATAFFNSSSSCRPRFFMTWISPLNAFGQRELFSVSTLFKSHPDACLLIVSAALDSAAGRRLLSPFAARGFRVAALSPDYLYLFNNTPAEGMVGRLRDGKVLPGNVPIGQNLSNLLRLLLLYKYGGVYVDTDVVVLKSFLNLKNAIGAQAVDARTGNWTRLNNAVLVFDEGHPLLHGFIKEFARNFDGSKWGHNGPYLVSRVVSRMTGRRGVEFTVLPPPAFYPVDWRRIGMLFVRPSNGDRDWSKWRRVMEETYALHLWNRQSRRLKVEAGSVIGRMMSELCVLCDSYVNSSRR